MRAHALAALALATCSSCGRLGYDAMANDAGTAATDGAAADAAVPVDGSPDAGAPRCAPLELYVGVETMTDNSMLQLSYDERLAPGTQVVQLASFALDEISVDPVGGGAIRTIASMPDGRVLVTDVSTPHLVAVDLATGDREVIPLRGADVLLNTHAACALPDGALVAGEFAGPGVSGARIQLFDSAGSFLADVATARLPRGAMSDCWASDSGATLFYVEGDTTGLVDGEVVRLERMAGTWTEVSRFEMSVFDSGAGTAVWTMLVHSDGFVYFAPGNWTDPSRISQLLRCPAADLSPTGCETLPGDIPTDGGRPWVYGLGELPCSDDLLVLTPTTIYRYDRGSGAYTPLFAVDGSPGFRTARRLVVR